MFFYTIIDEYDLSDYTLPMNIKAVIFDMDGVIVDSEKVITKACLLALSEFGITAVESDFKPFTGMGENSFIGGVANKYGHTYDLAMKKRAYEIYVDIVKDELIVYEGISQLISDIKSKGYLVCLASSADLIKVKANLQVASIPVNSFDSLVCGDMVKNKKPSPDIFLLAASQIDIKPANCLVIEDALSGIKAAKAANMKSVAVLTSFKKQDFALLNPDFIVKNTVEILKFL